MKTKFSPSINILRDFNKEFHYIPTPNALRIYREIISGFKTGIHAFNIIGSYGTGKSAFLLALEKTLTREKLYFEPVNGELNGFQEFAFLNLVSDYTSLVQLFGQSLKIGKAARNKKELVLKKLQAHYERAQKNGQFLFIVVDEFGKFLEYAAKHNPEEELYFVQQLSEFVADKNIIFIVTLHQGFDAYATNLYRTQRREWEKVKGRLKELVFNEPVEQLLFLAAKQIKNKDAATKLGKHLPKLLDVIDQADVFPLRGKRTFELAEALLPLDILSAAVLTLALQEYGQNERSLFSFLNSSDYLGINDAHNDAFYNLADVYDYLLYNHYTHIQTKHNFRYVQWSAIRKAIERVESIWGERASDAVKLVKTIGILNIFGRESARIDLPFLCEYGRICLSIEDAESLVKKLSKHKIIRYLSFKSKYILFEGTDLDIELAVSEAANKIPPVTNIVPLLRKHFTFPYFPAKAVHYKYGTPRFFEFELSDQPIAKTPAGEIDGFINLIFSERLTIDNLIDFSKNLDEPILFGFYKSTKQIRELLFEIQKVSYVIDSINEDRVALRELSNLRAHLRERLSNTVLNRMYSEDVVWVYKGKRVGLANRSEFNRFLSRICEEVYRATPVFRNELVNRHKLSSSITIARRNFFEALLNNWTQEDLGFPKDKFPAEKTIYYSLLKKTEIHRKRDGSWVLDAPTDKSFNALWQKSEAFLQSAKVSRKNLGEFVHLLVSRPFKLKQGFVEFWLPLFLFIKRDDFALFGENGYVPFLTSEVIELIIKKPEKFQIKTFDVTGVKLDLFNKYRDFLNKEAEPNISNQTFVETIKPFLSFYQNLPEYAKKTKRLSKTALAIRAAIADATDPEKTFFEDFPKALGCSHLDLINDKTVLQDYVCQLQDAIRELRTCYDNLVDRLEAHFLQELGYDGLTFGDYKAQIQERYRALKQHLLLPYQKSFYLRLQSQLNDRKAWINSLVHALLGKTLDALRDDEEELLFDKFSQIFLELDSLSDLSRVEFNARNEDVLKLEMTSSWDGHTQYLVRIPKSKQARAREIEQKVLAQLSTDKKTNIAVLSKLLKQVIDHDQS